MAEKYLTSGQLARIFHVNIKTAKAWTSREDSTLKPIMLPSGHRRYREAEVIAFAASLGITYPEKD